ncbi:MAG: CBS domain containing-hemolysin-like protein [Mariniblastus sp.]
MQNVDRYCCAIVSGKLMDGFYVVGNSLLSNGLMLAAEGGHSETPAFDPWIMLLIAAVLVVLNGFFVAAEFALVKVRMSQIEKMVTEGKMFAKLAKWLAKRLDHSLSACQLGITMASLALGYVGEPAFAFLIEPIFEFFGITQGLHIISFVFAFSVITSLHLVIGEQAPKIFAIRRPQEMVRWCAPVMVFFFYLLYPFMYVLNWATEVLLSWLGLTGGSGHGSVHTEDEIRALLRESQLHGQLSDSEGYLLNNVFEFDDLICRLVMVPRSEVDTLDVNASFADQLKFVKETRHTRYPVCDGSLDNLLGVVHVKDLLGLDSEAVDFDIRSVMRDPVKVPENMPITEVLTQIQETHQLLTFVVDEYGLINGVCTLENVLEKIIGPVDDEFDKKEEPGIQSISVGEYLILGNTPIADVEKVLDLNLDDLDVDTVAGVIMTRSGKVPEEGDRVEFKGATAVVLEVKNNHAERIRFSLTGAARKPAKTKPPEEQEPGTDH